MVGVGCRIGDVNISYATRGKRIRSPILLSTVQVSCDHFTLHMMHSIMSCFVLLVLFVIILSGYF